PKESLQSNNDYAQYMLTKYGLNYINNLKIPEAWLRFAKYHPSKYIRRYLFISGYEINSKDHWKNFVFHIKNNLTSHKQIGNNSKYRDFKVQLALCVINYSKDISFMEKTN
ncbi:31856_t:CDS:1, partial [Gigaspora margarita]